MSLQSSSDQQAPLTFSDSSATGSKSSECTWGLIRIAKGNRPLVGILLVGIALLILRAAAPERLTAVMVERLQLLVFPLLIVSLYAAQIRTVRIPRLLVLLACATGLFVTAYGYLALPKILGARLSDDTDESASRLFRERVQFFLDRNHSGQEEYHPALGRYFRSFQADSELRALFGSDAPLQAVVWGDSKTIRISLRGRPPIELERFEAASLSARAQRLEIVDSVPVTALASEPRDSTAFFVARILEGLGNPIESGGSQFERDYNTRAVTLRLAAEEANRYPSRAHRAFALWRAGTNSLVRYLASGAREIGYLDCARGDLERAQAMLISRENPDLSGAILNNLGVAALLRSEAKGDSEWVQIAHRYFKRASQTGKLRTVNGETLAAFRSAQRNSERFFSRPVRSSHGPHRAKVHGHSAP